MALFFSEPILKVEGFMPVVVFDDENTRESLYPKFTLKGVLRVFNPNSFDVSLNEIKLYGRTQDSSRKYQYKGKPLFYDLNVPGVFESGTGIVKAYASALVKCSIAHFDNDQDPGVMYGPMKGGYSEEVGSLLFHIYLPSFNQLFKFNNRRVPYELVGEVYSGRLNIALVFNNELLKIDPKLITTLVSFSKAEWESGVSANRLYGFEQFNLQNEDHHSMFGEVWSRGRTPAPHRPGSGHQPNGPVRFRG
jgi:hypothetical protein